MELGSRILGVTLSGECDLQVCEFQGGTKCGSDEGGVCCTHCQVILGFIGFGLLASTCVLCLLLTLLSISVGQTFRLWVKSKTSLCRGECRMKLEVWPLEMALRVDS